MNFMNFDLGKDGASTFAQRPEALIVVENHHILDAVASERANAMAAFGLLAEASGKPNEKPNESTSYL